MNQGTVRGAVAALAAMSGIAALQAQAPSSSSVLEFVRRSFPEGVPYVEARAFGPAALDSLHGLLRDPAPQDVPWLANAVSVVGFIGNASSTMPLRQFFERSRDSVSLGEFQALLLVPVALGHISRTPNAQEAYVYLQQLADPSQPRSLPWVFRNYQGERLRTLIAKAAINGVGASGRPDAPDFLASLLARASGETQRAIRPNVEEARRLLERLQREGPDAVFGKRGTRVGSGSSAAPGGSPLRRHDLTINRHVDVMLVDSDVSLLLRQASELLQKNHLSCKDEVACDVELARSGPVTTFGKGGDELAIVTSQEELDAVFSQPANVKLVLLGQNSCGSPAGWLGCARMQARNMVLVEAAPKDVWAHEFGHTQGLDHLNSCDKNIMHATLLQTAAVDSQQCSAFRR